MDYSERYIIAIDSGTTSTRAILFDTKGNIVTSAVRQLRCLYPQSGYVNLDPNEIFISVVDSVNEILINSGVSTSSIIGIGLTNQRETTLLFDAKTQKPLTEAIVCQSKETEDIANSYQAFEGMIKEKTGLKVSSYFSCSKIICLLEKYNLKEKARRGEVLFGTVDTWLIYKLTGGKVFATDVTNASRTSLYNIFKCDYDDDLLKLFDIPRKMLPEVKMSIDDFGKAVVFPGSEIPILGVAGDQQSALFGQRLFEKGGLKNTYGTGLFTLLNIGKDKVISKNGLLTTLALGYKGEITYALEGSVFIGGAAVQWLRDELKLIKKASESEVYASLAKGDKDVYVVPAFSGLGTPYWDEKCRGAIFGMTRATSREVLVKATLESIAYQTYDVIRTMTEEAGLVDGYKFLVDGGATSNSYLMQFQSDILQKELLCPKMKEVTALGAYFMAGLNAGVFKDFEDIKKLDLSYQKFSPQMEYKESKQRLEKLNKAVAAARLFE